MSWQFLAGTVEWWATGQARDEAIDASTATRETTVRAAFVAQRQPWRLAELMIATTDQDVTPVVACWADGATAVLRGNPAEQHVVGPRETWGDLTVRQLLHPHRIEALAPRPWPARFEIAGATVAAAAETVPELISLRAERYHVAYDLDLDVLTSWSAVVAGKPVQKVVLRHLTVMK